jgi:hypothetical protein
MCNETLGLRKGLTMIFAESRSERISLQLRPAMLNPSEHSYNNITRAGICAAHVPVRFTNHARRVFDGLDLDELGRSRSLPRVATCLHE